MKGRGFRRQPKRDDQVRVVKSVADSWDDQFIPIELAQELHDNGKLKKIDLGPDYPHSYMRI